MVKVSVIVPVYNTEKYLRECLDSLVNQSLEGIEIVLVNDGSTDNSVSIINEYIDRYKDKILYIEKENGGQATARNLGIARSHGEYIGFVDSDDYVDRDMYEVMYSEAIKNDLDIVECDHEYIDEDKRRLKKYGHVRVYKSQKDMFIDPLVSPWNKLYRRDVLIDNNITFPEGYIYEDTSFFLKAIPHCKKWGCIDKEYVKHIQHDTSTMSKNIGKRIGDMFGVLDDALDYYKNNGLYEQYKDEIEYFSVKILLCSSLNRIAMVRDKRLKGSLVKRTLEYLEYNYGDYSNNKYVKSSNNKILRFINKYNIWLVVSLLSIKNKI